MPKVYPDKIDLFLAADALRQEMGGKITIMGAFAGGQILLPPDVAFPAAFPLGILAGFYTGEGTFKGQMRVLDPEGRSMTGDLSIGDLVKNTSQTMQMMVNFGIFQFPSAGKYTVEILLDDRVYSDHLTVSISPTPIH